MGRGVWYRWLVALLLIGTPALGADRPTGRFALAEPDELQFSDAVTSSLAEDRLVRALSSEKDPQAQLQAAQALWDGRDRRAAADVLKYLAKPAGGDAFRALQHKVNESLEPKSILHELKEGDYQWGAWLAFLRPHKDLVPVLIEGLMSQPNYVPDTLLALGNSGDDRALPVLLERLKLTDYKTPGFAASALGYLGRPGTEDALIQALGDDNIWRQVKACRALAKMGSAKAIPKLKELAESKKYKGALNVKGMAQYAVDGIKAREKAAQEKQAKKTHTIHVVENGVETIMTVDGPDPFEDQD